MKKKILFIVTEDWYFISHRLKLAKFLVNKGFKVFVCCKDTGKIEDIKKNGIMHLNLSIDRNSLSIFQFLKESLCIIKVVRSLRPDIVHLISMRPIISGILATLFVQSKFCATFTGMGFLFIKKNFKINFLRRLIINYLKFFLMFKNLSFIVQNKDDEAFFKRQFRYKKKFLHVIKGSGIDTTYYKFYPEIIKKKVRVAYAGRILKDKGILSLIEAFKLAKKKYANLNLYIAGSLDEKNPSNISKKYFEKLIDFEGIFYLGNIKNMKKFWQQSNIAILMSKREGLPLSLLEAAATGRAIISSDVTGSREIAIDKYNAINVKEGNVLECTEAILKLTKNNILRKKYGKNSRKLVENDMTLEHICNQYYKLYKEMI